MNSPIIGVGGMGLSAALLSSMMKRDSHLSLEEKERRKEERRLAQEERLRQAQIIRNICPSCEGKLTRGKKDKKNYYKRSWDCSGCNKSHLI